MSVELRTLLIDDEQASRLRLRRLLARRPDVEIIGEARDGLEATELIERLRPDLIFLDVQMPGLDGFDVLRAIAPTVPLPLVIFVTGYDEYALSAFQARALAYLLKPVEEEVLNAMVERAYGIHSYQEQLAEHDEKVRGMLNEVPAVVRHIVARKAERLLLLEPTDICFFWMDAGILRVKTQAEQYWVNYAIGDLERSLSESGFFRTHRSTLVNLHKVSEIHATARSAFQLVMKDDQQSRIDVSERQARALRSRIHGL
ncbi:LytTR family DNA-binding domain-containing protein [Burkholderia sp. BCC1972]|uniref:LytR/AlgR family response regulator transcription factor n=1 Tax=Burkholderia sp. BCC1972 TaxID=2817438 RepID=UPI002ABDBD5A|nr:LytTR family DNA-binding domain-containing protein [Burkholderia sp. BCC1972]